MESAKKRNKGLEVIKEIKDEENENKVEVEKQNKEVTKESAKSL